ncbi:MAG: hypothetical protein CMF57_12990, partial [Leifsonia sp.]|nr:hypothetical protein [Leifsonia sp.]
GHSTGAALVLAVAHPPSETATSASTEAPTSHSETVERVGAGATLRLELADRMPRDLTSAKPPV